MVSIERGHNVEGEAQQLKAEIEGNEVAGRNEQQHAGGGEQDENRIFEFAPFETGEEVTRYPQCSDRAQYSENFQKLRESAEYEAAVKNRHTLVRHCCARHAGAKEQ